VPGASEESSSPSEGLLAKARWLVGSRGARAIWLRVTRHRCRCRQRLRGRHHGSGGARPTLRRPSPRQPQTIGPIERGLTRPTGGTAQADSLVVAPLPRPTWAVAVGRSRSVEQPLSDTRRNLFFGRFRMGAKVFRGNHLHTEISELEGHLDTGLVPVEHSNILSREASRTRGSGGSGSGSRSVTRRKSEVANIAVESPLVIFSSLGVRGLHAVDDTHQTPTYRQHMRTCPASSATSISVSVLATTRRPISSGPRRASASNCATRPVRSASR
jgi:hypothetical protein